MREFAPKKFLDGFLFQYGYSSLDQTAINTWYYSNHEGNSEDLVDFVVQEESEFRIFDNASNEIYKNLDYLENEEAMLKTMEPINTFNRIKIAFRFIGRPVNIVNLTKKYNHLFPERKISEENILAIIQNNENKINRLDTMGTFGLREWVWKKPGKAIFETVKSIAVRIIRTTGKPVNINYLMVELCRSRPSQNPKSLVSAIKTNPYLKHIGHDNYILDNEDEKDQQKYNDMDDIFESFENFLKIQG